MNERDREQLIDLYIYRQGIVADMGISKRGDHPRYSIPAVSDRILYAKSVAKR